MKPTARAQAFGGRDIPGTIQTSTRSAARGAQPLEWSKQINAPSPIRQERGEFASHSWRLGNARIQG